MEGVLENTLRLIGTISRALDSIANVEFKELNLARGQYLYLVRIMEHPGIIQERLSELIAVDRTTSNRAVKKLIEQGLVSKQSDPINQKIKHLFVTPVGEQHANVILKENAYSTKASLAGLSNDEIKTLNALLKKMDQNVSQDWLAVKKGISRNY